MTTPDFVVVGHVVQDLVGTGWRLGGTASFAALQAQKLGLRAGIVTRVSPEIEWERVLPGIAMAGRPSMHNTRFENVYREGRRHQRVPAQAEPVGDEDLPEDWRRTPIALLGPVCGELPPDLGACFASSLLGVSAQGWLRRLDRNRRVRRRAWDGPPFWSGARVLFVSDEDLGRRRDQLQRWAAQVPMVVLTRDRRGARVYAGERERRIDAFPAREVDPTGAGDVFAAAFLIRYQQTGDVGQAARFAAAAGAASVEAPGTEGIAGRKEIEARLAAHPEVALR